ncbi:MAG: NUDIX hydrolase [Candidatus Aenigmarchaeota archaeon]|nr:NUDIX hydrolase [Candidatus Aenigmarchaeota archaeon]
MYKNPIPTVDIIIEKDDKVVLIRRKNEPFKGKLAIPGGFVNEGELIEDRAIKEAEEETSLKVELKEILGVYSIPDRDPRGHLISVVFIAKPVSGIVKCGDDAAEAGWFKINDKILNELSFDHKKIMTDYLKWIKDKGTYWSTK